MNLKELYFGCTTTSVQAGVLTPLACSLTLTSFDGKGKENGVQKARFTPTNVVLADAMKVDVKLPAARVVQINATILDGDLVGGVGSTATTLFVDDVSYIQYQDDAAGVLACGSGF